MQAWAYNIKCQRSAFACIGKGTLPCPTGQPSCKSCNMNPNTSERQSLQRPNSEFRDFFRHIRLLLPFTMPARASARKSSTEQRKVAVYQNRVMAVLISLLHLVPLAGAIILLVLHWMEYWVGGASDNGTTLQFAAKVHELSMQTSLVDILLCIIRNQALDGYLPLGALAGAAQAQ